MMDKWVRFTADGAVGFGMLAGDEIAVHEGDMFEGATPTGQHVPRGAVRLLAPCQPSKIIGLWNNVRELAARLKFAQPASPLYFLKAPSALLADGATIPRPAHYAGRVLFEGELGIVIGRRCADASEAEAAAAIFGTTCVNDVTALDLMNVDPAFPQWARAKSFDGFGAVGPAIATGLDPATLRVRSVLDGRERQNYPVADMFFPPAALVQLISRDMTLLPGDIISCGTSIGAAAMRPNSRIEISIDGIGTLTNIMG